MTRCPRCRSRAVYHEPRWASCLTCGEVVIDEPTIAERIISNATREAVGRNEMFGPRVAARVAVATLRLLGPEWREKLEGRSW